MDTTLISQAIAQLHQMSHLDILESWRYCDGCDSDSPPEQLNNSPLVKLNEKGHIPIKAGGQVLWLAQRIIIPEDLQGYHLAGLVLRLGLTWWAKDVKIFINGSLIQEGDLFIGSTRVIVTPFAQPGEEIFLVLRLVSPDNDAGALMRSLCIYEGNNDDQIDPGFVADELAVLQSYLTAFAPEKVDTLIQEVAKINWTALPDNQAFDNSLNHLRQNLSLVVDEISLFKNRHLLMLGHSHIDMAWLWPISETWDVADRTFRSVLKLQAEFPDLVFCHSSPALYNWIEQHRPDLFAQIQEKFAQGLWEITAGMWVEPDLNLINGESIVRQILYGQLYVREKFGQLSKIVWLPDTFGFCATLPQILKQGGIEYFVTQKLRWNDTTKFPHGAFLWSSPDGTEIFSFMSNPIGEGINPTQIANYAIDWEKQTNFSDSLWLFGCGDHGGGPTQDMLNIARRWQKSPFFPKWEFSPIETYLQQMSLQRDVPVWNDELYLEFHRGCYTSHAQQKWWNRHCEGLLYQAELFAALATISTGLVYPQAKLADAWKKVLFNQFHDILPGTAIPVVYQDADQAWLEVEQVGSRILADSLGAIAAQIALPPPPQPDALPIVVFNQLNWRRREVVYVDLQDVLMENQHWEVYDLEGNKLPSQLCETTGLQFLTTEIPSIGYRVFWLCPQPVEKHHYSTTLTGKEDWILENEFLRVVVDAETGEFSSFFDKVNHREIIQGGEFNQLQAFKDVGQYWDAWNIDPNYAQHPLPPTNLTSIEWIEEGLVEQRLRVIRQLGKSEFCQDYILSMGSPLLKIENIVNWRENHVLVKAAFRFNLEADYATYEIPCGAIRRPTQSQETREKAKWEVPALRWADLSTVDYGVSLLNDCKYGYDSQPNQLRLTLLRSPNWPTPFADRGEQKFTYAIYPHAGSWESAHTVRHGYALNIPLKVMFIPASKSANENTLSAVGTLLELSAENLVLTAFKQSESDPQSWILRCYESHGKSADLSLKSDLGITVSHPVDILERPIQIDDKPLTENIEVLPWKILSFECS